MDVVMRMARVYDDGVLQDRLIKSQLIIMASWYCQVLHLEYLDAPTSDHSGMVTHVGSLGHGHPSRISRACHACELIPIDVRHIHQLDVLGGSSQLITQHDYSAAATASSSLFTASSSCLLLARTGTMSAFAC